MLARYEPEVVWFPVLTCRGLLASTCLYVSRFAELHPPKRGSHIIMTLKDVVSE